jgi:phosphinothricin acetyltransferase
MDPEIRAAVADDFDAITAIYADAVLNGTASYELEPPSRQEMLARFDAVTAGGLPYRVAVAGGRVAGFAYLSPFRSRPAYRFTAEDSIYVDPAFHRRRIGTGLLAVLVHDAERMGLRQVVAVIGDGRANSASIRLHEALGFRHSGNLEGSGFKHGRWLDTVFMQRALNGGSETPPPPDR